MKYQLKNEQLSVELMRDFNFTTARRINELSADARLVSIDISHSKIVDSEALISIYNMVKKGKQVELIKPPEVLYEAMEVLGLDKFIKENKITIIPRENE